MISSRSDWRRCPVRACSSRAGRPEHDEPWLPRRGRFDGSHAAGWSPCQYVLYAAAREVLGRASHSYELSLHWTGNLGSGTRSYHAYSRDHEVHSPGKPTVVGSADPVFRGDPSRWNPEELLMASLSQCHMRWYLHLAAEAGVIVTAYADTPAGTMRLIQNSIVKIANGPLTCTDAGREMPTRGLLNNPYD